MGEDYRQELMEVLAAFLDHRLPIRELERWVVGLVGLPSLRDEQLREALDALDVALIELSEGLIGSGELYEVADSAFRKLSSTVVEDSEGSASRVRAGSDSELTSMSVRLNMHSQDSQVFSARIAFATG